MSNDDPVDKKETIYCKVYEDGFLPSPGIHHRAYDLDFERVYYRFNMLESNIQDISRQIQELKDLYHKEKEKSK